MNIDRRLRALTRLLAFLTVALLALGGWSVKLSNDGKNTSDTAKDAAKHALAAVKGLQQSRIDITFDNCRSQNAKHDSTIRQLDIELLRAENVRAPRHATLDQLERLIVTAGSPADSIQLQTTHNFTVLLINRLAPKADCHAQLDARFGPHHPPPSD